MNREAGSRSCLPFELLREVAGLIVRPALHNQEEHGRYPEVIPRRRIVAAYIFPLFKDVVRLTSTSCASRSAALEFVSERVAIRSTGELEFYLNLLPTKIGEAMLGRRTIYLDVQISGPYDPEPLARLLSFTPNLATFIHRPREDHTHAGLFPRVVLDSLMLHARHLQTLYLDSTAEAPVFNDIMNVMGNLTKIKLLHIRYAFAGPFPEPRHQSTFPTDNLRCIPSMETLSLGSSMNPELRVSGYGQAWHIFFFLLISKKVDMPSLRRLEDNVISNNPLYATFFSEYGKQLQHLFSTDAAFLKKSVEFSPNLRTLVIELCSERPWLLLPRQHATVEEVHVLACADSEHGCSPESECESEPSPESHLDIPTALYDLLGELWEMEAPSLKSIIIHTNGTFRNLGPLNEWQTRWKEKDIVFTDHWGKELGLFE